ncbi:MAG TPA: acyltransferase [Planctomycetota bacterium]|nr:acyltransferase [Planctomycetota bacterium]
MAYRHEAAGGLKKRVVRPRLPCEGGRPMEAPAARPRYAALDLWRALACVAVIVFHASAYAIDRIDQIRLAEPHAARLLEVARRGWLGVPLFFVMSGYCIAATIDSSRRDGRPVRDYFWRRLRRIYPPFWVMTAATLVAGLLAPAVFYDDVLPLGRNPHLLEPAQWFGNATLTEMWRFHVFGPERRLVTGHSWSLCYEEQFYAVMGAFLLLCPGRVFLATVAVTLASAAALGLLDPARTVGFFFDGQWLLFAAGVAVHHALNHAGRVGRAALVSMLLAAAAWSARDPAALGEPGFLPQQSQLAAFAFAACLVIAHRPSERLAAARALHPLRAVGRMSYSVYLVHWPVTKALSHVLATSGLTSGAATLAVTIPAAIVASLGVGFLFHRAVERHFLTSTRPA